MLNKLIKIPVHNWSVLRDMYLHNWPKNMVGYYTMDNYIKWIEKRPSLLANRNFTILSLNDDWKDGTFIITDGQQLFINSLNDSYDRLKLALYQLNWSKGYRISAFYPKYLPAVEHVIEGKKLYRNVDTKTFLYFLDKHRAATIDVKPPKGFTLSPMSVKHAAIANESWFLRHHNSVKLFEQLIDMNLNIGVFDEHGKLVSWCFRVQSGSLCNAQVDKKYLRHGLGSLVIKWMVKQLALQDLDSFGYVRPDNIASRRMLESIGFQHIDNSFWMIADPDPIFKF